MSKNKMNKVVKQRLIYGIIFIIVWIVFNEILYAYKEAITGELFRSIGGALRIIGIMGIVSFFSVVEAIIIPTRAKELENEDNDERLEFIRGKTGYITITASFVILILASILTTFLGEPKVAATLEAVAYLQMILYSCILRKLNKTN